jgi:SAM-dependent methyltransferase
MRSGRIESEHCRLSPDLIGSLLADQRSRTVLPFIRGRLLDIGCGSNRLVRNYGSGVGVDVYDWGDVDVLVEDSASLPFEDRAFDTVTIIAALNHIPNREKVLKECNRVLAHGGRLLITMIPPLIGTVWHRLRARWDVDQKQRKMALGEEFGLTSERIVSLCGLTGFVPESRRRFMLGINALLIFRKV